MENQAKQIIDAFNGPTALAKALEAPISTVFSWQKIGIPKSRMAHIRLAAKANGIKLPQDIAA